MKRVFLTGATGTMGLAALKELLKEDSLEIITLVMDTKRDRKIIEPYLKEKDLKVYYGDLSNYDDDPIIFHNCLDNVLEYVTDKDSGVLLKNCCGDLPEDFWGHIYNIGGGPDCRLSTYEMFKTLFELLGIKNLENVLDSKWFALRNFHGQYFLDSDKLNDYLNFRSQGKEYIFDLYMKRLGLLLPVIRAINRIPGGEKLTGRIFKTRFKKLLYDERGTLNWIINDRKEFIEPFFISREKWAEIPPLNEFSHYTEWDKVIWIDHGYDESKPESELSIEDLESAAEFRGGRLLSRRMEKGDWQSKLEWQCAFGHEFRASPRLILEGGHWCPVCERESWNYHEIAKRSPFFAQVWYPLHDRDEPLREYPKKVSELDVFPASL